jgi:branched-chain amino acid transport system permease protein
VNRSADRRSPARAAARQAVAIVALVVVLQTVLSPRPPLGVILNGVVLGLLYALVAAGLVLVYRASRIISFAQAGLGGAPAVAGFHLYVNRGWPFALVVVAVVVMAAALGALVEIFVIRRFARSPRLILTVATIGVAQLLLFAELFVPDWVAGGRRLPPQVPTPLSDLHTEIGGYVFRGDHLLAVVVVLAIGVGLAAFLKLSRIGLAVRAVAENATRAELAGIPVHLVSTVVWSLAAVLSATGVFLRAPIVGVAIGGGGQSPTVLLYTLVIAVIARMQSLPAVFVTGAVLGMADQAIFYSTRSSNLTLAFMLPAVLVVLLLQRDRSSRATDGGASSWLAAREQRPVRAEIRSRPEVVATMWAGRAALVGLLLAAPAIVGPFRQRFLVLMVIYALVGLSLVVLTGWSGQISLGQFAFTAVGAATAGGLTTRAHADLFVTLVVAGVAGAIVAVIVGLPALRLQGLFLAVTTLAFAAATTAVLFDHRYFAWLLPEEGASVERPVLFGRIDLSSDRSYYYFSLVVLAIAAACCQALRGNRSGRAMLACRDHPKIAEAFGISVARTRLAAFAMSGYLAATAGVLLFHLQGALDRGLFDQAASIELFALTVIGGIASVGGALAGAAYVVLFEYLVPDYSLLATGAGMLVLLLYFPGGLVELGHRLRDALLDGITSRREPAATATVVTADDAAGPDLVTAGRASP